MIIGRQARQGPYRRSHHVREVDGCNNQGRPMSWRPCETFLFSLREAPSSNEIASGRCLFRPDRMQSGMCGSFCAVRWCKALFRDGHHMANAVLALISHASDPSPIVGRWAENDPADFETDPANGWPRSAGFLPVNGHVEATRACTLSLSDGVRTVFEPYRIWAGSKSRAARPTIAAGSIDVCVHAEEVEVHTPFAAKPTMSAFPSPVTSASWRG